MQYDVEADWYLLETCDFRCYYCGIGQRVASKLRVHASAPEWQQAFHSTGKTWLLHITGGEPGIYPNFVDLCEQLTQTNYLSINSNLSDPRFVEFARRIDPERVHFFNAGLHYEMRRRPGMLDEFVHRALALQNAGFAVLVSQVMTPPALRAYPKIAARLDAYGLTAIPKVFRGTYRGRTYPEDYSTDEKDLFLEHAQQARERYKPVYAKMSEMPTVDLLEDRVFLNGIPSYVGSMCSAGSKFVSITPDGSVFGCNPPDRLGNLLSGDVRFFDSPRKCDTSYCGPYFCEKYCVERHAVIPGPRSRPAARSRLKRTLLSNRHVARANTYRKMLAGKAKRLVRVS